MSKFEIICQAFGNLVREIEADSLEEALKIAEENARSCKKVEINDPSIMVLGIKQEGCDFLDSDTIEVLIEKQKAKKKK